MATNPSVDVSVAEGDDRARPMAAPAAAPNVPEVVLEFPWGSLDLEPGIELEIGQEVGPLAADVAAYPTVSGRHALIWRTAAGQILLLDEESTNGTWLNGVEIPTNTPVEVSVGDNLTLSRRLPIRVRTKL